MGPAELDAGHLLHHPAEVGRVRRDERGLGPVGRARLALLTGRPRGPGALSRRGLGVEARGGSGGAAAAAAAAAAEAEGGAVDSGSKKKALGVSGSVRDRRRDLVSASAPRGRSQLGSTEEEGEGRKPGASRLAMGSDEDAMFAVLSLWSDSRVCREQ